MKTPKLIIPLLLLLLHFAVKAQTPSINEFQLQFQEPSVTNSQDSMMRIVCMLTISDTVNVSNIDIKVGSTAGDSDVFIHTFSFTSSTGLPAGTSYSRTGNVVTIVLGDFLYADYYYEAKLQDGQDNWSPVKQWGMYGQ